MGAQHHSGWSVGWKRQERDRRPSEEAAAAVWGEPLVRPPTDVPVGHRCPFPLRSRGSGRLGLPEANSKLRDLDLS